MNVSSFPPEVICPPRRLDGGQQHTRPRHPAIVGAVALANYTIVMTLIYRAQRVPLVYLPLFPIGALITSLLLSRAAKDLRTGKAISWGGMSYAREAR